MKVVFASRTGNVESIVNKLGVDDLMQIESGNEEVHEDYILFTYTDGYGDVPVEVDDFLSNEGTDEDIVEIKKVIA